MTGHKNGGNPRLKREKNTLKAMFYIFCSGKGHARDKKSSLCGNCSLLYDYACKRIDLCPFSHDKPTCVKCPVHCYDKNSREAVKEIMRYSGPKMPLRHPFLSAMHVLDGIFSGKGDVKKCSK